MGYLNNMEDRGQQLGGGLSAIALILTLTICNFSNLNAQSPMTLGALDNVPQLNLINPANTTDSKWYIGIPLLSSVNASYRNSSFSMEQLGFGNQNKPNFTQALQFADTLNNASAELYIEDFAFGINLGKSFFSLTIAERIIASTEYPDQLLQWLGSEQDGADIPLGQIFDLSEWNFSASHYREIALGLGQKLLNDKLSLAGRAKLLLGQAAVQSDNYNFRLWHRPEQDYNYEISGRMDILASGFDRFGEGANPIQPFGKASTGIAFDLGAQYQLGKNITLFASVTDIGKIDWKKNNTFTSIRDIAVDSDAIFDTATDNLAYDRDRGATSFSTELETKIYGGGRFNVGKNHAFSFLVNPKLFLGRTTMNGSVAYRFRTSKFVDLVASYNVMEERGNNIGFGATINLKPVQIYFATDKATSIFNRNSQKDFQFVAGVNLSFGQAKPEIPVAFNDPEFNYGDSPSTLPSNIGFLTAKGEKKEPQDKYFTFYGTVFNDESDEPLEAIYVDVYVVGKDDERELIHTSRYPGHTFNVPLFQSDLKHEISVGGHGFARQTLTFTANVPRLEHEFRMTDRFWSVGDDTALDLYPDPGQSTLVSVEESPAGSAQDRLNEEAVLSAKSGASEVQVESLSPTAVEGDFEIIKRTSLRLSPDPQAKVLKRIGIGTTLELLEKTDKDWWKMRLNGQIGYVKQRLMVGVQ